ncbi:sensor histidine kinase [Massilimaliae timonensis]|uniref:Sensor histidine kinase n=1 Tax=Massiliimalia timonensis TaxID=1987501 RepID=A0A8J6PLN3_9FIRM|nr:sensor histidine kinase [Massiliimalia timonensis]MBC8611900.1 sensor histidine kinase [Massiliimalia timonensis]
MILISLIVTAILINTVSTTVNVNNALGSARREQALIINNLNTKITHIQDYAVSVAVDPRVIAEAKEHPSPPVEEAKRYKLRLELNKIIGSIMGLNRNVYMWDLVAADNSFFGVSGYDMSEIEALLSDEYFTQVRKNWGVSISGPYQLHNKGERTTPVFLVTKPVVDLDSRTVYGYVMFVIKESNFASIFENNMPQNVESSFYILNEEEIVISSSDKTIITQNIQKIGTFSEAELKVLYGKGSLTKNVGGQEMLYTISQELKDPVQWTVISCQPLDSLLIGQKILNKWILVIGTVACLVALFISYIIARSLSRPIMELASTIHDAAEGNLSQKANRQSAGEIEILYEGFNNLMNAVNRLLRRVYQEQEEKSEYQFHLIQAQIKPHFLYNTLEMIKSLIDLEKGETASQCISAMASFYRLSLNRGNDIISVYDEVKLSQQYMYLQKLRYIEYLDYRFNIPEELTKYQLPKMTLQPILENSIYHGIKEKQEEGIVEIELTEHGDSLRFVIVDNGIGMTKEMLSHLQQTIKSSSDLEESESPKSFGMASVNRRLKLLYGENYSFVIESEYGEFTKVTILIPKNIPEDLQKDQKGEYEGE